MDFQVSKCFKFHPNEQNRIWVSDVTFIRTSFGWSYLCVILDLYSRKTVFPRFSNFPRSIGKIRLLHFLKETFKTVILTTLKPLLLEKVRKFRSN
ncbi:hypothetical protein B2G50_00150 [Leptospira interrogans serovar Canicola]|nr:hypothetical protein B2G50_00150 [Leptospira interrogans serovar Canicola]